MFWQHIERTVNIPLVHDGHAVPSCKVISGQILQVFLLQLLLKNRTCVNDVGSVSAFEKADDILRSIICRSVILDLQIHIGKMCLNSPDEIP